MFVWSPEPNTLFLYKNEEWLVYSKRFMNSAYPQLIVTGLIVLNKACKWLWDLNRVFFIHYELLVSPYPQLKIHLYSLYSNPHFRSWVNVENTLELTITWWRGDHIGGGCSSSRSGRGSRCWCSNCFNRSCSCLGWWEGGGARGRSTQTILPWWARSVSWVGEQEIVIKYKLC